MENYILYVGDVETTGFDPIKNDVIELSLIRLNLLGDSEQNTWYIKPKNIENISEEALQKNGHNLVDITWQTKIGRDTYILPEKAVEQIESWIVADNVSANERVFSGYNSEFDYNHIRSLWHKAGYEETFPFSTGPNKLVLDIKQIIMFIDICSGKRRDAQSLSNMIKAFKVKKEKAHRADADTRMTAELLTKIISPIKQLVKDNFEFTYG